MTGSFLECEIFLNGGSFEGRDLHDQKFSEGGDTAPKLHIPADLSWVAGTATSFKTTEVKGGIYWSCNTKVHGS